MRNSIHQRSGGSQGASPGPEFDPEEYLSKTEEQLAHALPKVPTDIEKWNQQLKKQFDPFDKVVLVKGIDNSILTSYRTLKGENNTVSDTFKIVHRKFLPSKANSSFYKKMIVQQVDKMPYQVDDQEIGADEAVEFDFIEELPDEYAQPPYPMTDE